MRHEGRELIIPEIKPRVDNPALRAIFDHVELKSKLVTRMAERGIFWSYEPNSLNKIDDETLISNTYTHGDLVELVGLLYLFPLAKLKTIWKKTFLHGSHLKREGEFVSIFLFNEKTKI